MPHLKTAYKIAWKIKPADRRTKGKRSKMQAGYEGTVRTQSYSRVRGYCAHPVIQPDPPHQPSHTVLKQSVFRQFSHTTAGRHLQWSSRIVSCTVSPKSASKKFNCTVAVWRFAGGIEFHGRFSPLHGLSCRNTEVHMKFYRCVINTFYYGFGTSMASAQKQYVCVCVCVWQISVI